MYFAFEMRCSAALGPAVSGSCSVTLKNLALGGLFVVTQDSPAVGTSLQLLFNAPEGEVRVRAILRIWCQDEAWAWPSFLWSRNTEPDWTDG